MIMSKYLIIPLLLGTLIGCAPDNVKQDTLQTVNAYVRDLEPGKAMLHFYRPKKFLRGGLNAKIFIDKDQYLKLRNGEYQAIQVLPGDYKLRFSKKINKSKYLGVKVKSGEHVYLKVASEYQGSHSSGANYYVFSNFTIMTIREDKARLELDHLKIPVGYTVAEAMNTKPISAAFMTCNRPYKLPRDCSSLWGPKRKVNIEGTRFKMAGNSAGDIIVLFGNEPGSGDKAVGFITAKKILQENNIKIKSVRSVRSFGITMGYVLILDRNGYDILSEYTQKKN